ncbi:thioredoxin domain-containing protein [Chlamydiifrater phoenicopteri]|uniref:thioredoxin domain-containing protein n=1 Tax=Chlamydiifrater phoenicopteri TaxID=2681469 RepID=UPI001BCE7E77|nr:thioredoxin domain-containing protein [Chlamydiifrater phoenicopteri]
MQDPLHTNKLITEKSPYLLSYAHTPVNWYPWGKEAFDQARAEDKPIFLSIGGTSSRWCRVMLLESYQDAEVAAFMNQHFVNVKVDKEEMPHIADLYSELTRMLAASADIMDAPSWPLNVFLSPDLVPFFSVNYLSKEEKFGFPSFLHVLKRIHESWEEQSDRDIMVNQGHKVVEVVSFVENCRRKEALDEGVFKDIVTHLYEEVDPCYGGIKVFPKKLCGILGKFLLRYGRDRSENRSLFIVDRSLEMMALGGIHDHIGQGFFSYTIDDKWLIPNFEKRLIDNLFMAQLYLEAGAFFDKVEFSNIGEEILAYICSSLRISEGGFQTAEDGGALGSKEGNYYTWSSEEIRQVLKEDADIFCEYYGICREGFCNGRNVPHIPVHLDIDSIAAKYRLSEEELQDKLASLRDLLKAEQAKKERPLKDDLVIACGNGLAISVFVQAGLLLNKSEYIAIAEQCGNFLLSCMWKPPVLYRRWREGDAKYNGGLEDYGAVLLGALALFQAGRGIKWLRFAMSLVNELYTSFRSESGCFYTTDGRDKDVILKQASFADKGDISGNALVAESLITLASLTGHREYFDCVEEILQTVQSYWRASKFSTFSHMIVAESYYANDTKKFVINVGKDRGDVDKILSCFEGVFISDKVLVWFFEEEKEEIAPLLSEQERGLLHFSDKSVIRVMEKDLSHIFTDLRKFREYLTNQN